MGNSQSLNAENYPHVWIQGKEACQEFSPRSFPFDDKPPEIHDTSDLWDRFGFAISEHLPNLNRNMTPLWIFYSASLIAFIVVSSVLRRNEDYEAYKRLMTYGGTYIFGTLLLFSVGLKVIVQKNQAVDKRIESICELFNAEFLETGYSPEYRTQYTGWCKPRYARPLRLIVFKPTGKTEGQFA